MSKPQSILGYFKKIDTPNKPKNEPLNNVENSLIKNQTPAKKIVIKDEPKTIEKSAKRPIKEKDRSESPKAKKRRRLMVVEDDDDLNNENEVKEVESNAKETKLESPSESNEEDDDKPMKKANKKELKKPTKKEVIKNDSDLTKFSSPKSIKSVSKTIIENESILKSTKKEETIIDDSDGPIEGKFKHFSYEFLKEDKLRDAEGRLQTDPNYDKRTLYIPEAFKKTVTPAIRQWWDMKTNYFDVILFFKVGKFYELYHMDAVVAVQELGLTYMKGDYAHCGFPEIAFSRYADSLISKGFKVGRVEQTETPDMLATRKKETKSADKTVRRELCRLTTPGTKTFNVMDSDFVDHSQHYLISLIEKQISRDSGKTSRLFGLCFVDTSFGKIHIAQFEDDRHLSKLRTTFVKYVPTHVIYQRNSISKETKNILDNLNVLVETLAPEKEMLSARKLLQELSEAKYFKENDLFKWPETIQGLLSENDSLGLTPKDDYELGLNAFGGVFWYLKQCLIDGEILSMKSFEIYNPDDDNAKMFDDNLPPKRPKQKYMILDSTSLVNLEVVKNNYDGSTSGTLFEKLDFCNTAFGKRLLKNWLLNPLYDMNSINERLDAVDDLITIKNELGTIVDSLKSLPDLERLLSKIHCMGNIPNDHPETRAIMYMNDVYSKKKVDDFISVLNGFTQASSIFDQLNKLGDRLSSSLLKSLCRIKQVKLDKGGLGDLESLLEYYKKTFDLKKAKQEGYIEPTVGVNEEYDQALEDIKKCENTLEKCLKVEKKNISSEVKFFGSAKNRYQLEIPEHLCNKLPNRYEFTSSRKGFKRYWTQEIKDLLADLSDAENRRDSSLRNTMKCLFKNFDNHYQLWSKAVQCLALLDVLLSLTQYKNSLQSEMCRPSFVHSTSPFIDIRNGIHPSLTKTFNGADYIPNDVIIGKRDSSESWHRAPVIIVTGPNMGGKSTLMRQAGLLCILAQIGSYVPCASCTLTPVDRIFTRIGASDKIFHGESTFFLEMSETSCILKNATQNSLVLIDELGRGTATYDGVAIAFSVVKELANRIRCLTLFSTHYHYLIEEFENNSSVSLGHMQSIVNQMCDNSSRETITFLYKFIQGACPKSHGFNAAQLAQLPDEIIQNGSRKANEFESLTKRIQTLKLCLSLKSKQQIHEALKKI